MINEEKTKKIKWTKMHPQTGNGVRAGGYSVFKYGGNFVVCTDFDPKRLCWSIDATFKTQRKAKDFVEEILNRVSNY